MVRPKKNVLVVGEGGREHALCWKLAKSDKIKKLYCSPGNAGIAKVADILPVSVTNHIKILEICKELKIDLVIVGPEVPLVTGLTDILEQDNIKTFGPRAAAAIIEGSKSFMKELLLKYSIPTAPFSRFNNPEKAKDYIHTHGVPIVVKADGLAGGKGVIVCKTKKESFAAIEQIMTELAFGSAGNEIILEKLLVGQEVSFFALVDGTNVLPMATAQDHKTVLEGDKGLNTGGMGAYSPALAVDSAMTDRIMKEIMKPLAKAMVVENRYYRGVLFAGLMIEEDGPKVIEFNCRFGDPECQVIMSRLESDLLDAVLATVDGNLDKIKLKWDQRAALTVIMAANGYPGPYQKNTIINGVDLAEKINDVVVFHSGTEVDKAGQLRACGGRVLGVTGMANTLKEAQELAYSGVDIIDWPDGFCRRDIGWRGV